MENVNDGLEPKKPKTGGRAKGVPNKTTTEIRSAFQQLVENNINQITEDLQKMKPADRVKFLLELSKFVLPQLKAVELSTSEKAPIIHLQLGGGIKPNDNE